MLSKHISGEESFSSEQRKETKCYKRKKQTENKRIEEREKLKTKADSKKKGKGEKKQVNTDVQNAILFIMMKKWMRFGYRM